MMMYLDIFVLGFSTPNKVEEIIEVLCDGYSV